MHISGKVTHSFYCFLLTKSFDVSRLYELTDLEMEFLKDPAQWMAIDKVESFLQKLEQEYGLQFKDKNLPMNVGRSCFELGAWGDLDSVLKMKGAQAKPLFYNLPVFLSYFLSNGFFVVGDKQEKGLMGFKCNLSSEEYPSTTEYLRSALETLPVYTGKHRAEVKWIRHYIQVKWEEQNQQTSLFPPPTNINIKPELLKDLRSFLEKVEHSLYHEIQKGAQKEKEIKNLKYQMTMQGLPLTEDITILLKDMERHLKDIHSWAENQSQPPPSVLTKIDFLQKGIAQLKKIFNLT